MESIDQQLWQKILAGDEVSWAQLVRRYQALVYTVCNNAGLSVADAADCFQHTWLTLYNNRHKIKSPQKISAWLVTTAKREALRLRRLSSRQERNYSQMKEFQKKEIMTDLMATEPIADEQLERLQKQALLEIALGKLDRRCRRIMELFFFAPEDFSYEQIARDMGVSANTVGPVRRRCLDKLKKILLMLGIEDNG